MISQRGKSARPLIQLGCILTKLPSEHVMHPKLDHTQLVKKKNEKSLSQHRRYLDAKGDLFGTCCGRWQFSRLVPHIFLGHREREWKDCVTRWSTSPQGGFEPQTLGHSSRRNGGCQPQAFSSFRFPPRHFVNWWRGLFGRFLRTKTIRHVSAIFSLRIAQSPFNFLSFSPNLDFSHFHLEFPRAPWVEDGLIGRNGLWHASSQSFKLVPRSVSYFEPKKINKKSFFRNGKKYPREMTSKQDLDKIYSRKTIILTRQEKNVQIELSRNVFHRDW